jgi:hypothetical protein
VIDFDCLSWTQLSCCYAVSLANDNRSSFVKSRVLFTRQVSGYAVIQSVIYQHENTLEFINFINGLLVYWS